MTAEDGTGYDLLTIKVYVLKNPCMNQGVCEGPETDPNCTSTNRTTGGEIMYRRTRIFKYFHNIGLGGLPCSVSMLSRFADLQVFKIIFKNKFY